VNFIGRVPQLPSLFGRFQLDSLVPKPAPADAGLIWLTRPL